MAATSWRQVDNASFTPRRQDEGEMRIPESMPKTLHRLMDELGWKRRDLVLASGLRRQRIAEILRGLRLPNRKELVALSGALGVSMEGVIRETLWQPPRRQLRSSLPERAVERAFGMAELYLAPLEVPFAGRFAAARRQSEYEELLTSIFARLDQRRDRDRILASLVDLPCGSGAEATFVFRLLDLEARVITLAPLALGVCDSRLRDLVTRVYVGARPMRALALNLPHCAVVIWPQVPVRTESAGYTLDFLMAAKEGGAFVFGDLEIDGLGHDGSRDAERQARLALPTLRLDHRDLIRADFPSFLENRLRDLLNQHGRPLHRRLRWRG